MPRSCRSPFVRDERSRSLHVPDKFRGPIRDDYKVYAYGDATGRMKRIESPGNRSGWSIVNSVMTENLGRRYDCLVGNSNPSVIESEQSMNGKFYASKGDARCGSARTILSCASISTNRVETRRLGTRQVGPDAGPSVRRTAVRRSGAVPDQREASCWDVHEG